MSVYVYDCTNVVYMWCAYCIYNYVNKFEARSLFSTSHLKIITLFSLIIKDIGYHSHLFSEFWQKMLYFMNKYEHTRRPHC